MTHPRNFLSLAFLLFLAAYPCWSSEPGAPEVKNPSAPPASIERGVGSALPSPAVSVSLAPGEQAVKIIFGGALCPVCLIAFERKLKGIEGISFARVEKLPEKRTTGHPPKKASAIVAYQPEKISRQALIDLVRQNDFQFLSVSELHSIEPALAAPTPGSPAQSPPAQPTPVSPTQPAPTFPRAQSAN